MQLATMICPHCTQVTEVFWMHGNGRCNVCLSSMQEFGWE